MPLRSWRCTHKPAASSAKSRMRTRVGLFSDLRMHWRAICLSFLLQVHRLAARRGGLIANIALTRKLAALFWRVMVKGTEFVEEGLAAYEAKFLEGKKRSLRRLARELGQTVSPIPVTVLNKGNYYTCSWKATAEYSTGSRALFGGVGGWLNSYPVYTLSSLVFLKVGFNEPLFPAGVSNSLFAELPLSSLSHALLLPMPGSSAKALHDSIRQCRLLGQQAERAVLKFVGCPGHWSL